MRQLEANEEPMAEDERFDLIRLWLIRCAIVVIPAALSYYYPLAAYLFGMFAFMILIGYVDLFIHRVSPDDWAKDGSAVFAGPLAVMFHKAWNGRPLDEGCD